MIGNELYDGQGLGNQLWNYALARIIADKSACDFTILGRERFKGRECMDIDFGADAPSSFDHYYKEKTEYLAGTDIDISRTDPALLTLGPSTKFDGNCQSTKYLDGYRDKLRSWLRVKPDYEQYVTDENVCVIHFRAGDFKGIKDVFLPAEYYTRAMEHVRTINPQVRFCCVTDEPAVARQVLPEVEVIGSALVDQNDTAKAAHHRGGPIGIDFSYLLHARYLIIPNSSFSWWAAYLNDRAKVIIAPKYWARHNVSDGYWSTSDIITEGFTYMDRTGTTSTAEQCRQDKESYEAAHPHMFADKPRPSFTDRLKQLFRTYFSKNTEAGQEAAPTYPLKQAGSKVYDIFTFFNELELLEIRLNILDEHVDYFVIIESTETFSGKPKRLFYDENKERFARWHHKIIHHVTSDTPAGPDELKERLTKPDITELDKEVITSTLSSDNYSMEHIHWFKEFYQKESIKKALVGLSDNDLCFVSDLDEIWNPNVRFDYLNEKVFRLRQLMYSYFLNNRSSEKWAGTLATRYENIRKNCLNYLRDPGKTQYDYIKNGGWHFTNVGGPDRIRTKLESYGHQEFNNDSIKSDLENKIASNKDFIGRKFKFWVDETNLPEYIINNRTTYQDLFK